MNISPILCNNINQNNTSFYANDYISKKVLYGTTKKIKNTNILNTTAAIAAIPAIAFNADDILKTNKITYCSANDNVINVASGYNGGFYSIKSRREISPSNVKEYFAHLLSYRQDSLGGLLNYIDFVKDIKRQDIIQKGLKIYTYELNTNVNDITRKNTARALSKKLKREIKPNNMFYINNEGFYYDKLEKTAYGIFLTDKNSHMHSPIRICKFKTDDNGNAIGYIVNDLDAYHRRCVDKEYTEQTEPSVKLKPIAVPENNKEFAEAFRFGNSTYHDYYRLKTSMPSVLEHLNKIGIKNVNESKLQFVRFYDNNKEVQSRICYYDPTIGRSLIYNAEGKYMYQMEYNKDSNGNIIACTRF